MENYLPGYTGDRPNLNTGMPVTVDGQTTSILNGEAIPFGHLQRLTDKLFGAVEMNIDQAIAESQHHDDVTQRVDSPNAILPQSMASWIERNTAIITLVSLAALLGIWQAVRK